MRLFAYSCPSAHICVGDRLSLLKSISPKETVLSSYSWFLLLINNSTAMISTSFISLSTYSLLFLSLSFPAQASEPRKCYYPNGDLDPKGVPCDPSAGQSACCADYDACFESGVCSTGWNGAIYRRSCTDQTGSDLACPQVCTGGEFPLTTTSTESLGPRQLTSYRQPGPEQ